jgi:predicted dehydrogenase
LDGRVNLVSGKEEMENTYGHTPIKKAFGQKDVYGIGFDAAVAGRRKLKLGIIGAGGVAQSKHWPAIQRLRVLWEPVEVAAFVSLDEAQGHKAESIFGGRWYPDYRQMLDQGNLDGVIVSSPDALHAEHTIACLERGIPVLVEKPIARSLADGLEMCRKADEAGIPLMTVANKRYSPPYWRAHQYIFEGPVSNPAMFVGKFNLGYDYVDLLEAGSIHLFDVARYLMGDVSTVSCAGTNRYHHSSRYYPIDHAICTLRFASGAIGSLYTCSTALSLKPWERVEVYGDHAWLDVDDQYRLTLHDSETGPSKYWTPIIPNTLIFDEEFGGFMGMIENFLQVIRGEEKPLVTGWDGYRAFELLAASQISLARGGNAVSLPLEPVEADGEIQAWLKSEGWPGY